MAYCLTISTGGQLPRYHVRFAARRTTVTAPDPGTAARAALDLWSTSANGAPCRGDTVLVWCLPENLQDEMAAKLAFYELTDQCGVDKVTELAVW
jgi:hypothetical protein